MARIEAFENNSKAYEAWFGKNIWAYRTELNAIREMLPKDGAGLEIGVGSGRFAAPLNIETGIDPSPRMAALAQSRGIHVIGAVAEALPFKSGRFDFALMVTTICFVDDPDQAFREVNRILNHGGEIIVGFVDRESRLGRQYHANRHRSRFYRQAVFYSVKEIADSLGRAGFGSLHIRQTLFHGLEGAVSIEPALPGFGQGAFVVVCGRKPWKNTGAEQI